MKVLILWADNRSANLGVRALATGVQELAHAAFGDVQIDMQDFAASESGFVFNRHSIQQDIGHTRGPIKQFLRQYDLVIDTGAGDSLTDIYGPKRFLIMHYVQRTVQRLGIPIVFAPQTIGPFRSRAIGALAGRVLERADVVITRDPTSSDVATRLGRAPDASATDVVFAIAQPTSTPPGRADVVVNVSGLLWSGQGHVDPTAYKQRVRDLILGLSDMGRNVTLLPHVLAGDPIDNDVRILDDLKRISPNSIDSIVPTGLEDARSTLKASSLVIGSRMHACLNALSVGTPAIAWAYSRKFAPLLDNLAWPHVLDLRSDTDPVARTLELAIDLADGGREAAAQVRDEATAGIDRAINAMKRINQ